jgi:hypothetical protein
MPDILQLNLHREHFAKIAAKTKHFEYRAYTPYWHRRIENREYDVIQFRNGYATKAPEMLVEFLGYQVQGKGRKKEFAIRLGRILKIKRWPRKAPPRGGG